MNIKIKPIITVLAFLSLFPGVVMADELRLKNGDRLSGQVVRMEEEKLIFKTSYAGEISIKWNEVANLNTDKKIKIVLSDETILQGKTKPTEEGKMKLKMGKIVETVSFNLAEVKAINPQPQVTEPPVKLKGRINVGLTSTRGNTETENHHFDGEFVARTVKNRYTLGAELNKAEDDGEKTVDNIRGYAKYDHFLTEKWFLYSSASAEKDEFKDLNLRTDFGIGVGYQFFETPMMNLSLEAGLTYVNEDYEEGEDNDYPAGRWAVNFDRYFFEKAFQFFHFHEGFVGLEDTDDLFIRSRTGIKLPIYKKFKATAQYNYDWEKSPKRGRKKADEMYILTLGYEW
jgi:putative salt-induced outer membrane protein YdiY